MVPNEFSCYHYYLSFTSETPLSEGACFGDKKSGSKKREVRQDVMLVQLNTSSSYGSFIPFYFDDRLK